MTRAHDHAFPERALGGTAERPSSDSAVVSLRDVRLAFDGELVLDGIGFAVRPGETLCILGGSGTGKSTILRLILRLEVPDEGSVRVLGTDVVNASIDEVLAVRRRLGMVFQGAALFDSLTVFDNVAFHLDEHDDLPEEEIERRVREALRFVDLDPDQVAGQLPAELSGGMKKRVGIARAIIHRPEVFLFDEPTSGLDPITTRTINRLILKLQRDLGATSIVVTHDIRSAFHIAGRVALLSAGRIAFIGTPAEMNASEDAYVKEFLA